MMATRVAAVTWCTLAALVVPALAHAQGDSARVPAAETDGERAAPWFQEGLRAADETRWADAEAAYLKAWAITKTFDVAGNLGVVELKLGKPRQAAIYLAFSLRKAPPSTKAAKLDRLRRLIEQAKKLIGVVRARVTPPDAEVLVDGKPLPVEETAEEIFLEPGTHRITARRGGYIEGEKVVTVAAGTAQEVTLALAERPAATAAMPPATVLPTPSGATPAARVDVVPEARRSWVPVIALGAASAVGLGVAVGFTLAANAASADASRQRAMLRHAGGGCVDVPAEYGHLCSNVRDSASRLELRTRAATVAYVTSGALAMGAMAYALWPSARTATFRGIHASPEVSPGHAGIVMRGVW
ncbi:PEGA domain-containing protein [Sorangium cellulosum]|nr:PEGA domain-containing protein [Sorangium cellulosum]